jgi:hypothetical protein
MHTIVLHNYIGICNADAMPRFFQTGKDAQQKQIGLALAASLGKWYSLFWKSRTFSWVLIALLAITSTYLLYRLE